jgi:hypothetical protein
MAKALETILTAERALIFRITHRANLRWILENGVHCRRAALADPEFIPIGNPELIERRTHRAVDVSPGGTLDEYVPFYFTPASPMLLKIKTGHGGITQRSNADIAILVSSLTALEEHGVEYIFSDRHAVLKTARFFNRRSELAQAVDFPLLRTKDFHRDPEHPERIERYQAEALAHHHVPVAALLGVACYTSEIAEDVASLCSELGVRLGVVHRPEWYF